MGSGLSSRPATESEAEASAGDSVRVVVRYDVVPELHLY